MLCALAELFGNFASMDLRGSRSTSNAQTKERTHKTRAAENPSQRCRTCVIDFTIELCMRIGVHRNSRCRTPRSAAPGFLADVVRLKALNEHLELHLASCIFAAGCGSVSA